MPQGPYEKGTPLGTPSTMLTSSYGANQVHLQKKLSITRAARSTRCSVHHGTLAKEVRLAKWRNHAVKCFLDDPEDSDAFTVDAMPALRSEGKLLIPEAKSKTWVHADPEHLIAERGRQTWAWNQFAGSVRMLKKRGAEQDIKVFGDDFPKPPKSISGPAAVAAVPLPVKKTCDKDDRSGKARG